ncbi:alkaline phosphatase D family protein [Thalassomonas sp. RHCl1]|uniref:alkaline phosphatase D family protein n=1 Tax=Thalassomonas sp. RHCl1 TaxID=2995320 RepID=UPI00248AC3AD|nr:alkaline phosphatase D family protein [Thalassomonas sp. RHCl1]
MVYNRRKFIKTLVISAGAVVSSSLVGCGGSSNSNKSETDPAPVTPSILDGSEYFPQSVVSGDPRPDSVILWTRVDTGTEADIPLMLQVATDEAFNTLVVEENFDALASSDHCLKIRVTELKPGQHYYYRFIYQSGSSNYASRTGRTKTAPAIDADTNVKFAYVSCQDYIGRYYNNYLSILDNDDLDFVIHLGDYIYETTGDALFQNTGSERSITFTDQEGALTIGVGESATQAANSLDNYRQLYKTYRTDELLQKVHERFPMIAIWDDHEFSDDSWGDHATYLDGAADEQQTQRRKNSEIAYFEYMPIDHEQPHLADDLPAGLLGIDDSHLYPNTRIYRDFHFGKHLHLAMTDFRTNRPDHIIPEDAFPGGVEMDQASLNDFLLATGMPQAMVDGVVAQMSPYVDIDDAIYAPYKAAFVEVFTGLYMQELMARIDITQTDALAQGQQRAVTVVQGKLATSYLNQVLASAQESLPAEHAIQQLPALPETGVEQGIAFYTLGKTSLFNYLGSRYFVIKDTYDIYAGYKEYVAQLQGTSVQGGFDDAQTTWLGQTFATSSSTWKMLGSSVSFTPLIFDLSASRADSGTLIEGVLDSDIVPAALKQRFYLEADQWDGFPQYKSNFVEDVLSQFGVISLGGDVHSCYVTEHKASSVTGNKSFNFTTSSVSSGTFGSFLENGMNQVLAQTGEVSPALSSLPVYFDTLAESATKRDDISDDLVFSRMWEHGVAIVEVNANEMLVNFHNVNSKLKNAGIVERSYYNNPEDFLALVHQHKFRVANGELEEL